MQRLSYHTIYSFSDTLDNISLKDLSAFYTAGCFDQFWGNYNSSRKYFIFGWCAVPEYIDEVVASFNYLFKNIKIILVDAKPIEYTYMNINDVWQTTKAKANAKSVLLSLEVSSKYNICSIKYLYYIIHCLFRLFSLTEEVYLQQKKSDYTYVMDHKERDFCCLVSDINKYWLSWNYSYRGMGYAFSPENVLLLDDIDLCNKVFDSFKNNTHKQTDILFTLFYESPIFIPYSINTKVDEIKKEMNIVKDSNALVLYPRRRFGIIKGVRSSIPSCSGLIEQKKLYCTTKIDLSLLLASRKRFFFGRVNETFIVKDGILYINNRVSSLSCYGCGKKITIAHNLLYFGLCRLCAETTSISGKLKRNVCLKHIFTYHCNCSSETRSLVTPIENSKLALSSLKLLSTDE